MAYMDIGIGLGKVGDGWGNANDDMQAALKDFEPNDWRKALSYAEELRH